MSRKIKPSMEFVVDTNVHVEVLSPQNVIRQTIDKHNKATKQLVSGLLRFIRGEFNTTYRRANENSVVYSEHAKNYIPCFIGVGTGGIKLVEKELDDGTIIEVPDYDPTNRRNPPLTPIYLNGETIDWDSVDNKVNYLDTQLYKEVTDKSRYPIGVLQEEEQDEYNTSAGDIQQIIFAADVSPSYYNNIYGGELTDIFITEMGLFASSDPTKEDLLARVVFNSKDTILYVRPQDTIVIKWTISIVALNDFGAVDEETTITTEDEDQTLEPGTLIDAEIPYSGTIINESNNEGV